METSAIEQLIEAGIEDTKASVTGDGRHFEAVVESSAFAGKSLIACQRMVMATVKAQLESEELHALSIKTKVKN